MPEPVPFLSRLWLAWLCYFRVLFDGAFAARVLAATRDEPPMVLDREAPAAAPTAPVAAPRAPAPLAEAPDPTPALLLLGLLQREGRLVDFLEQDIAAFADAEVGAAARVVHEGCRRALRGHLTVVPVRAEPEGAQITLEAGFDPASVKLTGDVRGAAPYHGALRHRGWRAERLELPRPVGAADAHVLAPAEIEL